MIEITLCQWLRAFAAVIAVVPANNIFAVTLPKPLLYPSIKITRLISDIEKAFDGVTGEETANIQIDYWAKSPDDIKLIKTALIGFFNTLSDDKESVLSVSNLREQPSFEPKTEIFKQTLELTISTKE